MNLRSLALLVGVLAAVPAAAVAQTPPPDPFAAPPVPTVSDLPMDAYERLLLAYMAYVYRFHGATHTDGWNLAEMGLQGVDRDTLSAVGQIVQAPPATSTTSADKP